MDVQTLGARAKAASYALMTMGTEQKNRILFAMADALEARANVILSANQEDVSAAEQKGISKAMLDRLALNPARIADMANGLRDVAALPDPVGGADHMARRPNGLLIAKRRVPLGVIAMIYEARPNVTADAAGLCIKSGNAVILRGGSEVINTNIAIVRIMNAAGAEEGLPAGAIGLVEDTSRETATELMRLNDYVDVLIPRGGAGLIRSVVQNATVPIIETGLGNCHMYVDDEADLAMAERILFNAKCSRPAVCNAAEKLLIARPVAKEFLEKGLVQLRAKGVELRGCPETCALVPWAVPATAEDWFTEYADLILAVKVVDGLDEAISHINAHGTRHSECIVTENYTKALRFMDEVDAAAVYVNASTRFTDGGEFGLGAEIGISTQKLHARGPMGLHELTTVKYCVFGNGQVR
ncbi:MAG: glutamate-5-semialdehyde dehydrogenase [Christensenellales bacterium]|jgi:glutamate-5-semialdehyde dehydrogenase